VLDLLEVKFFARLLLELKPPKVKSFVRPQDSKLLLELELWHPNFSPQRCRKLLLA
jgi:hypothetical protein